MKHKIFAASFCSGFHAILRLALAFGCARFGSSGASPLRHQGAPGAHQQHQERDGAPAHMPARMRMRIVPCVLQPVRHVCNKMHNYLTPNRVADLHVFYLGMAGCTLMYSLYAQSPDACRTSQLCRTERTAKEWTPRVSEVSDSAGSRRLSRC